MDHSLNVGSLMDTSMALSALAALAQPTRLEAFRALVQAGPEGIAAGSLAEKLNVPPATLSFHLKELSHAGLVQSLREGRVITYRADFTCIHGLVDFLLENCCGGEACDLPFFASLRICAPAQPSAISSSMEKV
jgi:DNA-binding transcriptional ArsR family regulator